MKVLVLIWLFLDSLIYRYHQRDCWHKKHDCIALSVIIYPDHLYFYSDDGYHRWNIISQRLDLYVIELNGRKGIAKISRGIVLIYLDHTDRIVMRQDLKRRKCRPP